MLKFTKPEPVQERFKGLFFGDWGCGKSTAAMQTPKAAYVDMERGTDKYYRTLNAVGSKRLRTTSFEELLEQVTALSREPHEFINLVVDPITVAYQDLRDYWTQIFDKHAKTEKEEEMKDYGMRYWAKVKFDIGRLRRALLNLDMNIIVIAHEKDLYENNKVVGKTFDADANKEGFLFDNIFHVKRQDGKLIAYTKKQRTDLPAGIKPLPDSFEWTYAELSKIIGPEILDRAPTTTPMATQEQIEEILKLMVVFGKIEPDFEDKVFAKHKIKTWDDIQEVPAVQVISYIKKQMGGQK